MKISHISDTHGLFPRISHTADVIVHTGDISPNFSYDSTEARKQLYWWEEKIEDVKNWIGNRPFLFTLGNHDFFHGLAFEAFLIQNGIDAKCLHDQIYSLDLVNFYGFPYVPPINGRYNYESDADKMAMRLERMAQVLNETYVDVIAAHSPPGNILDMSHRGQRLGNGQMNTMLDYQLSKEMVPDYYLCGHIHENHGVMIKNGTLFSNAATVEHIIEI